MNLMTLKETAAFLKKSIPAVRIDIKKGLLPQPFKVGKRNRIDRDEVIELLKRRREEMNTTDGEEL